MVLVNIEKIDELELLEYLKDTSLANKVEIREYAHKVCANATIFVAREDENIIGVNIVYFNDYVLKRGYITHIRVNKTHRKLGIGGLLLRKAMDYAREHNFTSIALEVRKNNEIAMHLYTRNGFAIYQETENSYYMKKSII